ncbi:MULTISPECIES: DUF433 domain-containing protein [unclassified Anabaena]|uniref:DUF433 domain-containing protein n=1 Tax=unclassified Anabaena TaxID=2619674 RepID=UPI001445E0D9|nr:MULTISPECIES: DUF433 domain-containing protein [unclassified Anabaena]MTJ09404.1 DUF433 domain-containing protein [Anabaena sp. UHCC 0204]MTJ55515.1 DUF433 domain-containing protein [Anabaena sp. UHCC 0253]
MTITVTKTKQYIEQRNEGYWIQGTRVSLDSIVYSFLNGDAPEIIAQNFPLLSLEQVYGAIAFYLANREAIDTYLKQGETEFEKLQQSTREKNPLLYQKLKTSQIQKSEKI